MFLEEFGGCACPLGQLYVVNAFLVRADAQVQTRIEQEFGIALEELRYQLFHIAWVSLAADPLFTNAFEKTVWVVELAGLEFDHPLWVLPH